MEQGGYQQVDIFNSFYAQDLIMFGISNNIAEAVRLGEKMLGENGDSLTFEMAKAVKEYQLNHKNSYQSAMKKTGPIDTKSVYMNNRSSNKEEWNKSSIVNMDDPYWQEYMEKNFRSQDRYKIPSAYAWNYKPNGIMDEILDFKEAERKTEAFKSYL